MAHDIEPSPSRRQVRDNLVHDLVLSLEKGKPGWGVACWDVLKLRSSPCKSCTATVWWYKTRAGHLMPVDDMGQSHFANCPGADRHRRR